MFFSDFSSLVGQLIAQFTDAHVDLNDTTSCIVRMESGVEIYLEASSEQSGLHIFCFLGALPDRSDIVPLMIRLLQANVPPHNVGVFGFDETAHKFILSGCFAFEDVTLEELVQHMHRFHEKAIEWQSVISGESAIPALRAAATTTFPL